MPNLGELERSVMEVLWASPQPLAVREVHANLVAERDLAYTTVMTVLVRLVAKGLADRELDGRAWRYVAAQTREQLTAAAMHEVLGATETAADRSAALVAFVDQVTPKEAAMMREALAALEKRSKSSRSRTTNR